jgi:heparan-sulfate lyase
MKFSLTTATFSLAMLTSVAAVAEMVPHTKQWHVKLQRLPPSEVLTKLDLDRPGLEAVKAAVAKGDQPRALAELLRYYRGMFPPPTTEVTNTPAKFEVADDICRHVFQWASYKPADYGTNIDWTINPADDIEWVAVMYRFYWADDLTKAYEVTRDDKYARAFVELTTDWIAKHPLDDWTRTHPTLTHWKGFAWLDLQTGIRATRAVAAFKAMVHSEAVTPEFLAIFLASLYDHEHKMELIPMGVVHNKAIFEQCGAMNICHTFPEFRETARWAKLAVERTQENLLKQTTPDGIQREWCGGYHLGVLRDSLQVMDNALQLGVAVSDEFRQRVRAMCDYVFAIATPDLGFPMFGDTARSTPEDGKPPQLYLPLVHYSEVWKDPKYAARAKLDVAALPKQTSYAFESAGVYVMCSQWGTNGNYLALHCAPPALSGHDQPDNGTFELFAHGRWLMTDTGYYTYGHDKAARAWHRQTRVHQTLTLDGKDTKTDGRLRLWHSSPELDAVVVENESYAGLVHRRSVWFVDKKFYVFLDEAIGTTPGELSLHWTPAPGPGRFTSGRTSFTTQFPDANVLIQNADPQQAKFEEEKGWFAWDYNQRVPRTMLKVKHPKAAPARFLTVIAPYRGTNPPVVEARLLGNPAVGSDKVQISVRAFGKQWSIGRDLEKKTAWCEVGDNSRTR